MVGLTVKFATSFGLSRCPKLVTQIFAMHSRNVHKNSQKNLPLGWLATVAEETSIDPARLMKETAADHQLLLENSWTASPLMPEQESGGLDPFIRLAFAGLCVGQS